MIKSILILAVLISSNSLYATPLLSVDRDNFYSTTKTGCISNQSRMPMNASLSVGEIYNFCDCLARTAANTISYEVLSHMSNTGDIDQLIAIANHSASRCVQ